MENSDVFEFDLNEIRRDFIMKKQKKIIQYRLEKTIVCQHLFENFNSEETRFIPCYFGIDGINTDVYICNQCNTKLELDVARCVYYRATEECKKIANASQLNLLEELNLALKYAIAYKDQEALAKEPDIVRSEDN